jgi:hypothetical protein
MGMSEPYVLLRRRFCDVTKAPSTGLARRMLGDAVGDTWDAVVPITPPGQARSAVVVLAPSGLGKTAELQARAAALREAGVASFFMCAVHIGASGVAAAVDHAPTFAAWHTTTARAVFFIDALDEAKLEGHDVEQVLRRFNQDIDPSTRQVQLVLSSRNDVWTADDLRHVVRVLALPAEEPPIRIVRLEPLSLDDVRAYARANGVADADAFTDTVREEELDQLFDFRPPDAKVLIDYWKHNGRFGTWSSMLEASIEASVRNENRRHAMQQQFTLEEARPALARLGAATVLGKRSVISMPGASNGAEVNSERLFADRRPAWSAQLLAMGLFAPKGLQSVQLPQGAPTHFLAAIWLGERVKRGWATRALEDALFITPFGAERTLTPPSRSEVVGWVAGMVPALRERLLKELPHVLLFEGDPSRLSRGECIEALRAVLADIKAGRHDPSPTRGTVRQIAKHQIADAVVRLLSEFKEVARAERLLLRIAEVGRYTAVAAVGLSLALSPAVEESVGDVAIRLVATVGDDQQRRQLLSLVSSPSEWMRLALVQTIAPDILNGVALVQLVVGITERNVAYLLGHALANIGLADVDAILAALLPTITTRTVTGVTDPHLVIASALVVTRLLRDRNAAPAWIPRLLLGIEAYLGGPIYIPHETVEAIEVQLGERSDLRRAVWDERIARATNSEGLGELMSPKLGRAKGEDLEWFWAKQQAAADQELKNRLGWPLNVARQRMSAAERTEIMQRQEVPAELKAFIEVAESWDAHLTAARQAEDMKQAAEKAAHRAKNIADVQPQRAAIESGEHGQALIWAWQHLSGTDNRRGRIGTALLVEEVGRELAEVFMTGFQRWWRRHEPPLPEPGSNSVSLMNLAGLTGLSLEAERGLNFASLADAEVERAARYALYELNGFPVWFDDLVAAHPAQVRRLLAQVVASEWAATVEEHGVIARAPYEPSRTAELVRNLVIDELERGTPGHVRTVHYAVGALLLSAMPTRDVAPLLERGVASAAAGDTAALAEWLRGWSHFAPAGAAKWLRSLAGSDRPRFLQIIERVASLLEDDFDERTRPIAAENWTPAALTEWVRLLHSAVRPEDDIDRSRGGVYSPGQRDRAQEFRDRCLVRLARDPSREAFEALRDVQRSTEMAPYAVMVDRLTLTQLTAAAEHLATPWTEEDLLNVERGDERPPRSNGDLFALVERHLDRVAHLLENDDFSYATLFGEKTDEKEVQRWVASSLVLVNRGLYTVEREPELQDDKLIDISVSVPGIGRIPIEIKPLYSTRYPYAQLKRFIKEQLVGRYMRAPAVDRGIFLLVPLKSRTWKVGSRTLSFAQLRSRLAIDAKAIGDKAFKEVVVACIDVAGARDANKKGANASPPKRAAGQTGRGRTVSSGARPAAESRKPRSPRNR